MTISSLLKSLRRVPQSQKLFFVEHLRVMFKAGISLASAMKTLALQADNRTFREILLDIYKNIEKGNNFSNSLANYPRVFDDLFVNMIRAGEATGKLEDAMERLYIQIKKNYELKSKIKGALIYPTIILIAMVVIGIGVIVFVIPRVAPLFTEVGATLPLATRILITISEFIVNHGVFSAIAAIVLIAAVVQLMNNKTARHYFDLALLKLPIISPIIKKINLALFARTLSSLIKTDIPIVQTFQITSHVMSNEVYCDAIAQSAEKIKKGIAIKDAIKKYPELFSPVVLQMIAVGEETGSLDIILDELASFYEEEVSQIMNNLPSIIEPIIILLLGIGVAWIAIAVIMPIYSLAEQI